MIDYTTTFHGVPVSEISRDIKDGKWILKSQGNINGDIKAQTVVVYGNVKGNIKADQVVIINGNATGNIRAETVTKIESKEKKTCESCKYYTEEDCLPGFSRCEEKIEVFFKKDMKICDSYQEKEEEKKSCQSCKYHQRLDDYRHFYCCNCDNTTKEIKCEKYQKKENPAKQVFSPILPTKKSSIKDIKRVPPIFQYY